MLPDRGAILRSALCQRYAPPPAQVGDRTVAIYRAADKAASALSIRVDDAGPAHESTEHQIESNWKRRPTLS